MDVKAEMAFPAFAEHMAFPEGGKDALLPGSPVLTVALEQGHPFPRGAMPVRARPGSPRVFSGTVQVHATMLVPFTSHFSDPCAHVSLGQDCSCARDHSACHSVGLANYTARSSSRGVACWGVVGSEQISETRNKEHVLANAALGSQVQEVCRSQGSWWGPALWPGGQARLGAMLQGHPWALLLTQR